MKEPALGSPFRSGGLEALTDDKRFEELKELVEWGEKFLYTGLSKRKELMFEFSEGRTEYTILAGGYDDGAYLKFYRVEGVEKHTIHTQNFECHIGCMVAKFLLEARTKFNALQSIAAKPSTPNPNSPWARH